MRLKRKNKHVDQSDLNVSPPPNQGAVSHSGAGAAPAVHPEQRSRKVSQDPLLDELAEDMVGLTEALNRIERQVLEFNQSLGEIRREVQSIGEFRRELTSERRAFALRSMLDPIAGSVAALELVRKGMEPATDSGLYVQASAAIAVLSNLLQAMGFSRFEVAPGEIFDGNRMQSFGQAEGEPGRVIAMLHPGYTASGIVMRPAAVMVGQQQVQTAKDSAQSDKAGGSL